MLPDAWRPSQINRISGAEPSISYAAGGNHVDRRAGLDIEAMLPKRRGKISVMAASV